MHASFANKSDEMQRAVFFFDSAKCLKQSFIGEKSAVLHGKGNARQILIENFSGSNGHVSDFTVAAFSPKKTD